MHWVTLDSPISTNRWSLHPGDYLAEDLSAWEIGTDGERGRTRTAPYSNGSSGGHVLIVSNGGFGDAISWGPALRRFCALYPERKVALSTRRRVHCIFDHIKYAPELVDYPAPRNVVDRFGSVVTSEGIQEWSEEGRTIPSIDIKARLLGVGPLDDRRVEYIVSDEERAWASTAYPKESLKRIGVQLSASSPTRTYHPKRAGEVLRLLYEAGHELLLIGSPGSIPDKVVPERIRDRVTNLTSPGLSFRQSAAVAQTCDCLFVPDSSILHIAGAIGIPAVAIWGSTHWRLRAADYPTVTNIQSSMGCDRAPCWHHPKGSEIWPRGAICEKEGYCGPLNAIDPSRIVASIEKRLAKQATR